MKSNRVITLFAAAFGLASASTLGRAEGKESAETTKPPAKDVAAVNAPSGRPPAAPSNVRISVMVTPRGALATWSDIAGHTYDLREAFFAGLKRLEARADEQVRDLNTRRALLKRPADLKVWDVAMKEMESARLHLKAMGEEARQATPETWQQQKVKVGQAWARVQDAYEKVKFSTMG